MYKIYFPGEIKINGPWIINKKAIEELDHVIKGIEEEIEKSYQIEIDKMVIQEMDENKLKKEEARRRVEKRIIDIYGKKHKYKNIVIRNKQGFNITDNDLLNIIKQTNNEQYNPESLYIRIEKGENKFILEIGSGYDGELSFSIDVKSDEIYSEIKYKIDKWIDNYMPKKIEKIWSKWGGWYIVFILPFIFSMWFMASIDESKIKEIEKQTKKILVNGIAEDEKIQAIEIILRYIVSEKEEVDLSGILDRGNIIILGWILFITLVIIIKPITIIGIWKNKHRAKRYKVWMKFVLYFVPVSIIIPIIINIII